MSTSTAPPQIHKSRADHGQQIINLPVCPSNCVRASEDSPQITRMQMTTIKLASRYVLYARLCCRSRWLVEYWEKVPIIGACMYAFTQVEPSPNRQRNYSVRQTEKNNEHKQFIIGDLRSERFTLHTEGKYPIKYQSIKELSSVIIYHTLKYIKYLIGM